MTEPLLALLLVAAVGFVCGYICADGHKAIWNFHYELTRGRRHEGCE